MVNTSRKRENSSYGGLPFNNRSKFLINIIKKIKNEIEINKDFIITTRISIYDGMPYPYGFGVKNIEDETFPATLDLTEPIDLINKLYKLGIRLINISAGNPRYKPYMTRPYDIPAAGGNLPNEHPLYSVYRMIELTRLVKAQVPKDLVIVGSGYSYLREYAGYVIADLINMNKVDISGFGRMSFANPNFPKQLFKDGLINKKKVCIACSKCSQLMKLGKNTGCVIRDVQYKKSL